MRSCPSSLPATAPIGPLRHSITAHLSLLVVQCELLLGKWHRTNWHIRAHGIVEQDGNTHHLFILLYDVFYLQLLIYLH